MPEKIASLTPRSALPPGGRVLSEELRFDVLPARAIVQLRFAIRTPKRLNTLRIAGRPLPEAMNSWSGDDPALCRIAPDTCLLLSAQHGAADLLDAVRMACAKKACAITDFSDAFVTIAVEGPRAVEVLARGCGMDFGRAAFGSSACARTRLAQLPVILRRVTSERFECLVDRPAAQYLFDWMQDAAAGLD